MLVFAVHGYLAATITTLPQVVMVAARSLVMALHCFTDSKPTHSFLNILLSNLAASCHLLSDLLFSFMGTSCMLFSACCRCCYVATF